MSEKLRVLLLYACSTENLTFSYQHAWPRHFQAHPRFACVPINLADRRLAARLRAYSRVRSARFDAIVLLHSVFSNGCFLEGRLFDAVRALPQPKAFLVSNEHKMMPQKMAFCENLGMSLLISQTRYAGVHALYRERLGCAVGWVPSTGLDDALYRPETPRSRRPLDIGYRATDGPLYLGHTERRELADYFVAHAKRLGLTIDISLDHGRRFGEVQWAAFLNRCKGQLGAESGGDYFDLTDTIRDEVNVYLTAWPDTGLEEIFERFLKNRERVPIRVLSGRNVEAAGTETVQVLLEGCYDGYFQADEHYIPLKKDFSNIDDVMEKFRDDAYCQRVTTNARNLALEHLTYQKLIDRVHDLLAPLV